MSDRVRQWMTVLHRDLMAARTSGLTVKGVLLGRQQAEQLRAYIVESGFEGQTFGDELRILGLNVVVAEVESCVVLLTGGVGLAFDKDRPPYLVAELTLRRCPHCQREFYDN